MSASVEFTLERKCIRSYTYVIGNGTHVQILGKCYVYVAICEAAVYILGKRKKLFGRTNSATVAGKTDSVCVIIVFRLRKFAFAVRISQFKRSAVAIQISYSVHVRGISKWNGIIVRTYVLQPETSARHTAV